MSDTLDLQEPLAHQVPWFDAPQRFKVLRVGRRGGKTRAGFVAAMIGHGPGWTDFAPTHGGVAQGWDVVWLAPDYPQSKSIWNEDIKPRAQNLDGVDLNNSEFTLTLEGGGHLYVRSAEAIKSLRGLGAKLKGIVIDEAAWMDLRSHWLSVIRPILVDNHGWAIICSTTNAGLDGNTDHLAPSFFNELCIEIASGQRSSDEWVEFYGTAADNPAIDPADFQSLVKEYPPESVQLGQEVYAKLLASGAGLAFPEWNQAHHVVRYDPPRDWAYFASVDWGYSDHCAILFYAAGPRDLLIRSEIYVNKKTPYDVGYQLGQHAKRYPKLEYVAGGSDMWDVRDGGETIAEKFQAGLSAATTPDPIVLVSVARGKGSRVMGKMAVHEFLKYEVGPDGQPLQWAGAKLRVHADCVNFIRTVPARPIDPKNSEDVEEGGEDHLYDSLRHGIVSRFPRPSEEDYTSIPVDKHPGWDLQRRKKRPRWVDPVERAQQQEEALMRSGHSSGIRWGTARPEDE